MKLPARKPYVVDLSQSKRAATLQTHNVDVLRSLDELASMLALFPDFEGVPLHHTLDSIIGEGGKALPGQVRRVAMELRADLLNHGALRMLHGCTRTVGKQLLTDLRVGEISAQDLVERLARLRAN